jgi:hypothetical protein
MAAGTGGYGGASSSLLTSGDGSDAIGEYVATKSDGSFTITGNYTCTAGAQVYLYSLGGDAGSGANSASGLLEALGQCPVSGTFAVTTPYVVVNEVTTVAAAFSLAGFATDATHIGSSGTTQAQAGIANAFVNAATLANIVTGTAPAATPSANGTVPQAELNSIANILAACVNSSGTSSTGCSTLLADARSSGSTGTVATDTATAAINIAHNPAANVAALYGLQLASTPFQPSLTTQPADFTVTLLIPINVAQLAVDASGNVWGCGYNSANIISLFEFSSNGALVSPAAGYAGGGLGTATSICYGPVAIDPSGNIWTLTGNSSTNVPSLSGFLSSGTPITGSPFTGNGLGYQRAIAIDGTGNIWVANGGTSASTSTISKFSRSGVAFSGSPFKNNGLNNPSSLAIDSSGNVWVYGTVLSKFTSTGAAASGSPFGSVSHNQTPIAIDASNNVWLEDPSYSGLVKLSNAGVAYSGSPFTGGGAANGSYGLAVDGLSAIWADSQSTSFGPGTLNELADSGAAITPSSGYVLQGVDETNDPIVVDPSGSVWVVDDLSGTSGDTPAITITIGAASPVVTPLSVGEKNSTLGTRP